MFRRILSVLAFTVAANAATVTFDTLPGATSAGGPVSAEAVFTTSLNTLTITLRDLLADPGNVGQLLSDLQFVLSTGQTSGSLTSGSGQARTVAANGSFTNGGTVAAGWVLENSVSGGLRLCDLCGGAAGPAHTIIGGPNGSNVYGNANSSIAGNGPHNPFLAGDVTFVLNIAGVTTSSTVTGGFFSFGTTEGDNIRFGSVPEPVSSALVGTGLIGLFFLGRRARKA